jgi:hypothetical protein
MTSSSSSSSVTNAPSVVAAGAAKSPTVRGQGSAVPSRTAGRALPASGFPGSPPGPPHRRLPGRLPLPNRRCAPTCPRRRLRRLRRRPAGAERRRCWCGRDFLGVRTARDEVGPRVVFIRIGDARGFAAGSSTNASTEATTSIGVPGVSSVSAGLPATFSLRALDHRINGRTASTGASATSSTAGCSHQGVSATGSSTIESTDATASTGASATSSTAGCSAIDAIDVTSRPSIPAGYPRTGCVL